MRWRHWRRRFSLSGTPMTVRSHLPWPLRWLLGALTLGLSAVVMLWSFEFGKEIAGIESGAQEEVVRLRADIAELRLDLIKAQAVASTHENLLTAERAAQEELQQQIRQLEADNRSLRADLGFFERLIPTPSGEVLGVRGLQVERLSAEQLRWQVLLIQAVKQAPDFEGTLELMLTGTLDGKPWSQAVSPPLAVSVRQYLRLEGVVDVPPKAVIKALSAKVMQGGKVKTTQTLKLS